MVVNLRRTPILKLSFIHIDIGETISSINLDGMYAFAIFDKVRRLIICAVDRFCMKPFNYHLSDNDFIFASEAKSIIHIIDKANFNKTSVLRNLLTT